MNQKDSIFRKIEYSYLVLIKFRI